MRTAGTAEVHLRNGHVYVGHIELAGGLLHASGIHRRIGAAPDFSYRAVSDRVWPQEALRELRWAPEPAPRPGGTIIPCIPTDRGCAALHIHADESEEMARARWKKFA